mmetsp:Transcript_11862/g.23969  ORF Transcript_11862/g.23969 Transcript_11862/m.23969 type:complete len:324 (+) Transcript_11862:64-1035(+)
MSMMVDESDELTHSDIEEMLLAVNGRIVGLDTDDNEYDSILPIWDKELTRTALLDNKMSSSEAEKSASELVWYHKAFEYWESDTNCPITDDGVLGGYGAVTPMDTRDSNNFLNTLLSKFPLLRLNRVADCGAGIGRVAKNLLLPRCQVVDLVEQSPRLLAAAPVYLAGAKISEFPPTGDLSDPSSTFRQIGTPEATALVNRVNLVNVGLQDFAPVAGTYDVIWIQWVIGHLHDLDCIQFFRRCAAGLTENGLIVLKDNVLLQHDLTFLWDKSDSSVARHKKYMKLLLTLAGLQVVQEAFQTDFPEELFPVMLWAITSAPPRIA